MIQPPSAESGYQRRNLRRAHRMKSLSKWPSVAVSHPMAERDVGDWLYARFLKDKAGTDTRFAAGKLSISAVAACVFVWLITALSPLFRHLSYTLCAMNWFAARKNGTVQIKGETVYKVTDVIDVTIAEVRMKPAALRARSRNLLSRPIPHGWAVYFPASTFVISRQIFN